MSDPARIFFRDPSYDGQLARTMSAVYAGAADLGEVLATARRVASPDPTHWYDAWSARADATRAIASEARASNDRVTARNAALRASEYYRQAYYFLRHDLADPRLLSAHAAHVDTFGDAIQSMTCRAERVAIPYDGTTLKGYLFAPDDAGTPRATLLMPCGYDSTAEAGWMGVPSALERGYQVLLFEGPGQGEALYGQKLFFRPDFEHVLTPVIDWLVRRPDVDATRLVLIGRSFGGYLALRAATAEHRIAALVCDPAQPTMTDRLPDGFARRVAVPVVEAQMFLSKNRAEFFGARMAAHGLDDIAAYFRELERFSMLDRAAEITCPTLVVEAEHDFAGGSGAKLVAALRGPATLLALTEAEGAEGHCAGLGQRVWEERVYGWLGATLRGS